MEIDAVKIAVIGAGYVGLVNAACYASIGNEVVCIDNDQDKIEMLNAGQVPFYESGLSEIIAKSKADGLLKFSTSINAEISKADFVFICVGTPPKENGQANLDYVLRVAEEIGKSAKKYLLVVTKSTVPVGTAQKIKKIICQNYSGEFDIASCPEFLREGSALNDFMNPDRIIIGTESERARLLILRLYEKTNCPKVLCSLETSEMIKYASNAFLATKISFINEIANVCENVGADVELVAEGMGFDKRIGQSFLKAGLGYGGSCFPKDVRALHYIASQSGYSFQLLQSVLEVNARQRWLFYKKIEEALGSLENKTIGIWGLSFKPETDDVRESIAIDIIGKLIEDGAKVKVYDPEAMKNAQNILGDKVQYCFTAAYAADGVDCLLLLTDWNEFKQINFESIRNKMTNALIIDGRNSLDSRILERLGIKYISIGRGASI